MRDLVVSDVRNVAIGEPVHLVERAYALIFGVISIESVAGQHVNESSVGLNDYLGRGVREVGTPSERGKEQEKPHSQRHSEAEGEGYAVAFAHKLMKIFRFSYHDVILIPK